MLSQAQGVVGFSGLPASLALAGSEQAARGGLADWQLKRVERHVEAHLAERVRCATLAAMVRLSTSHFGRTFRASTGQTPHAYVMERRMARAKILMRESDLSLSVIALECGMADQSHFSRVFAALEGMSPGVWRRRFGRAGRSVNLPDTTPRHSAPEQGCA